MNRRTFIVRTFQALAAAVLGTGWTKKEAKAETPDRIAEARKLHEKPCSITHEPGDIVYFDGDHFKNLPEGKPGEVLNLTNVQNITVKWEMSDEE